MKSFISGSRIEPGSLAICSKIRSSNQSLSLPISSKSSAFIATSASRYDHLKAERNHLYRMPQTSG